MRSINHLIQHMNKETNDPNRKREYDAFKQLDDNIIELQNRIKNLEKKNMRYFCRAYRDSNYSVAGAGTTLPFPLEYYPQFGSMHDKVFLPHVFIIRRDGVYEASFNMHWDSGEGGTHRSCEFICIRNGSWLRVGFWRIPAPAVATISLSGATSFYFYKDDFVFLWLTHDAPANATIVTFSTSVEPFLSLSERMEDLDPSEYGLLDPNANMR